MAARGRSPRLCHIGTSSMSLRLQVAIISVLAAGLAGGWWWFAERQDAARSEVAITTTGPATLVLVEALDLAENRVTVRAIGTGEAIKSAAIYPSVAGEVVQVAFAAEQRVQKGDLLVQLDDKHQKLAVRLEQVAVKEAERQLERLQRLAPTGAASRARLETAGADLESARLRLDQARAALADRSVYAPFSGVIGLSEVDPGDRVTRDSFIATLDDRSGILVDFNVPEDYAGRIRTGDSVTVRAWTAPEGAVDGTVTATGSRIDPRTRTLRVRALIPNADDAIRPGTSFEVELPFTGDRYPRVREVAVLWSRDGPYLWRVAGGRAEKVFVTMVSRNRGFVLVDGALQAGDLIVVEGVQGLRAGQEVDPAPFEAGPVASPPAAGGRDRS